MIIYVDCNVRIGGDGSREYPFQKMQQAADIAKPGDEVLVAPGVYYENVNPIHSGTKDKRIVYRSEKKNEAVITGAEPIKNWMNIDKDIWEVRISNGIFGEYNPYKTLVSGDWFIATNIAHTGEVYLNDKSMYEVEDKNKVYHPEYSEITWDREFSLYTWYTQQDEENDETILIANFQGLDPNKEKVEINVRRNCFYPQEEGVGYITLSGFKIEKAATQWAPPTAYQEGMVGPHWSKGWIIEDCEISNAKCSGISLGKYKQIENDNKWSKWKYKDGTQTERDCICQAQMEGWSKEKIGSHIVRRCEIHDCGQAGIVGHLGGVFSIIEDNHIHHINHKHNLAGAEIGGIKMHAAIDVIFRRNHIHHCTRGLWLDWQAQGTRVTQNLFHDNTLPEGIAAKEENVGEAGEDIFVEVSHGPTLIDNNILLSQFAFKCCSTGIAFLHNLVAGSFTAVGCGTNNGTKSVVSPRYTPYHVPHRTEIAGFMTILHGDARFYNNIFVQQPPKVGMKELCEKALESAGDWTDLNLRVGTVPYNEYQTEAEWKAMFEGYCGMGSKQSDRYYLPLPVWTNGNAYFNGAMPIDKEQNYLEEKNAVKLELEEENGSYYLKTNLYEYLKSFSCKTFSTRNLGMAFEPEQRFENPDGTEILLNTDYFGAHRALTPMVGPFEENKDLIKVW